MSLSPEIGNLFDKLADYCWTLKKCADSLSPYPTSSGHITLVGYNITSLWIVFPNYTCAFYLFTNTFVNVHIVLFFPPGINEVKRLLHIGFSASVLKTRSVAWRGVHDPWGVTGSVANRVVLTVGGSRFRWGHIIRAYYGVVLRGHQIPRPARLPAAESRTG